MQRITVALICALFMASCARVDTTTGSSSRHAWTTAGLLRVGIQRSPNTLNPILPANTTEAFVDRLLFDGLVSIEPDGKTQVPILAAEVPTEKNGGISADGMTITYKLRTGVKWHDGVPFTSKDVKFSWSAVMNDANNVNTRVGYEDVKSVDTPDDATVVFHLKHKFAPFVNTVFGESDQPYEIMPEHILGKLHDINKIPFNQEPIGTGPFKVSRWIRGDHIELVANDDYFRGKPKLRSITIREIPDENTELNALRAHEIDWMFEPSPHTGAVLKALPTSEFTIDKITGPIRYRINLNTSRPILHDVHVRRAIAYAVDKKGLVDRLTAGFGTPATADQAPFSWAYKQGLHDYGFDPAKGRAELRAAGWSPGPDGIMRKGGQTLSLQLSYNVENATRRLIAVQLQAALKAIGIDIQIKTYPANLFFASYGMGGIQTTGKYDLAVDGWVAGIDPDDHSLFRCDQMPEHGGTNYTRYCTKKMDDLQNQALGTYDEARRKPAYDAIQQLIIDDSPEIDIFYQAFPQTHNIDLKGFAPNPVSEAWNAHQWEI